MSLFEVKIMPSTIGVTPKTVVADPELDDRGLRDSDVAT